MEELAQLSFDTRDRALSAAPPLHMPEPEIRMLTNAPGKNAASTKPRKNLVRSAPTKLAAPGHTIRARSRSDEIR